MHLAFIVLISEHCELMVSLFVCSFFITFMVLLSSILYLHLFCLEVPFLSSCHVSLLSLSLME